MTEITCISSRYYLVFATTVSKKRYI